MPNNICNLFFLPIESENKINKYIKNAEQKMDKVCKNINNGIVKKRGFNIISRILGLSQGLFFTIIEKKSLNTIKINNDCDQCCICVKNCPTYNLEYKNGIIIQKSNCTICYRCMNRCPKKAITLFFRKKIKKQYKGIYNV